MLLLANLGRLSPRALRRDNQPTVTKITLIFRVKVSYRIIHLTGTTPSPLHIFSPINTQCSSLFSPSPPSPAAESRVAARNSPPAAAPPAASNHEEVHR